MKMTEYGKFWFSLFAGMVIINAVGRFIYGGPAMTLPSADAINAALLSKSALAIALKEGDCLWLPYIFAGMPSVFVGWIPPLNPWFWGTSIAGITLFTMGTIKWWNNWAYGLVFGLSVSSGWVLLALLSPVTGSDAHLPVGHQMVPFVAGLFIVTVQENDIFDFASTGRSRTRA